MIYSYRSLIRFPAAVFAAEGVIMKYYYYSVFFDCFFLGDEWGVLRAANTGSTSQAYQ
eukprot:m.144230 g.144230  ORF g.144230 m.144230 type:complete len:58 (-) comp30362_c3_seq7:1611-1784(-)